MKHIAILSILLIFISCNSPKGQIVPLGNWSCQPISLTNQKLEFPFVAGTQKSDSSRLLRLYRLGKCEQLLRLNCAHDDSTCLTMRALCECDRDSFHLALRTLGYDSVLLCRRSEIDTHYNCIPGLYPGFGLVIARYLEEHRYIMPYLLGNYGLDYKNKNNIFINWYFVENNTDPSPAFADFRKAYNNFSPLRDYGTDQADTVLYLSELKRAWEKGLHSTYLAFESLRLLAQVGEFPEKTNYVDFFSDASQSVGTLRCNKGYLLQMLLRSSNQKDLAFCHECLSDDFNPASVPLGYLASLHYYLKKSQFDSCEYFVKKINATHPCVPLNNIQMERDILIIAYYLLSGQNRDARKRFQRAVDSYVLPPRIMNNLESIETLFEKLHKRYLKEAPYPVEKYKAILGL